MVPVLQVLLLLQMIRHVRLMSNSNTVVVAIVAATVASEPVPKWINAYDITHTTHYTYDTYVSNENYDNDDDDDDATTWPVNGGQQ